MVKPWLSRGLLRVSTGHTRAFQLSGGIPAPERAFPHHFKKAPTSFTCVCRATAKNSSPAMSRATSAGWMLALEPQGGTDSTWRDFQASPFYDSSIPSGATLDDSLPVRALRLSVNGSFLGVSNGAQIQVFNSKAGEVGHVPSGSLTTFAVSPDGGFVVEQNRQNKGGNLLLWNLRSGQKTKLTVPSTLSGELKAVNFSPDGKQVIGLSSASGRISLLTWRADVLPAPQFSNPQVASFESTAPLPMDALSATGQLIATRSGSSLAIRRKDGALLKTLNAIALGINEVAFSPDGQLVAAREFGGEMRLWNVQTGQQVSPLPVIAGVKSGRGAYFGAYSPQSMVFSSDHKLLARTGTINQKNEIEVWSIGNTPQRLASITASGPVTTLAFSPNKRSVIYGDTQGMLRSVDVATQQLKAQIKNGLAPVSDIVFTSQGMMVVGKGNSSSTVTLYSLQPKGNFSQQQKPRSFFQEKGRISLDAGGAFDRLTISPQGQYIATVNHSNISGNGIKIWSFPSGALLQSLSLQTANVEAIAFSPDGTRLTCLGQSRNFFQKQVTTWQSAPAPK